MHPAELSVQLIHFEFSALTARKHIRCSVVEWEQPWMIAFKGQKNCAREATMKFLIAGRDPIHPPPSVMISPAETAAAKARTSHIMIECKEV